MLQLQFRTGRSIVCSTALMLFLGSYDPAIAQIVFVDHANAMGVQGSYGDGLFGGGLSLADFNGDGWDDLSLATERYKDPIFYQNMGGTFQLVDPPFVRNRSEQKQILWADVDNDGDQDLYICGMHQVGQPASDTLSRLYLNDGNMAFTDITVSAGLPTDTMATFGANFGDVNNDGFLDLLILNRSGFHYSDYNRLFVNNGNLTFTEVTQASGLALDTNMMFCAAFFDMDNDLDQDIYMAHDKHFGNPLYINQGAGMYTEESAGLGADLDMDAMNVGVGDYNNDGYLDIYITNTHWGVNPGNKLLKNNNGTGFMEVAQSAGVEYNNVGWGANWFDLDNDMDLDLYCSGSWPLTPQTPSVCYENLGNGTFSSSMNFGFVGDTTASYANAVGDLNNDGFPDIVVHNESPDKSQLWMNSGGIHHWLKVGLEGTISNRDGVGSMIEAYVGSDKYIRYTHCGIAYLAQNSSFELFGLGTNVSVDSLKVRWLSGIVDVMYNVAADQTISIVEGSTNIPTSTASEPEIQVKLFPNPAGNALILEGAFELRPGSLKCLSALGAEMEIGSSPISTDRTILDVAGLSPGIYILRVQTERGPQTIKWMKE